MKDVKEVKSVVTSLLTQNNILNNIIYEKDKIIKSLMDEIEDLQETIEYIKVNGAVKQLVLKRN